MDKLVASTLLAATLCFSQQLVWEPNEELDLMGYQLWFYGPTNGTVFLPQPATNYSISWLPTGEYSFLISAMNSNHIHSIPSDPLFWTNAPQVTVVMHLQSGDTLGQWTTVLSFTNQEPVADRKFYRALMEVQK